MGTQKVAKYRRMLALQPKLHDKHGKNQRAEELEVQKIGYLRGTVRKTVCPRPCGYTKLRIIYH